LRGECAASGAPDTGRQRHHVASYLKIIVRIKGTASRIRMAFAANWPEAARFRALIGALIKRST
jgi:hypothetical protein